MQGLFLGTVLFVCGLLAYNEYRKERVMIFVIGPITLFGVSWGLISLLQIVTKITGGNPMSELTLVGLCMLVVSLGGIIYTDCVVTDKEDTEIMQTLVFITLIVSLVLIVAGGANTH